MEIGYYYFNVYLAIIDEQILIVSLMNITLLKIIFSARNKCDTDIVLLLVHQLGQTDRGTDTTRGRPNFGHFGLRADT